MRSLGLLGLLLVVACVSAKQYNSEVLRVTPTTEKHLKFLSKLHGHPKVDFWKDPSTLGTSADMMVSKKFGKHIKSALTKAGLAYDVAVEDVDSLLQKEQEMATENRKKRAVKTSPDFLTEYGRHAEINTFLEDLASGSSLCTTEVIGQSFDGRNMTMLKISSGGADKPTIFVDGGVHAREWISPAVAVNLAKMLANRSDSSARDMVDSFDWYILPVANPDGYEYSHTTERLWRKNRRVSRNSFCAGVDLNRNFGYKWGGSGTSTNPCSDIYRGTSGFSEPESANMKVILDRLGGNMAVYLSFHSYGQDWLHSWGYGPAQVDNEPEIARVGQAAADAIYQYSGSSYQVGSAARLLYAAAGGSDDYAKSIGANYSYTVELPPTSSFQGGFELPTSRISSVVDEMWQGVIAMVQAVKNPPATSKLDNSGSSSSSSSGSFFDSWLNNNNNKNNFPFFPNNKPLQTHWQNILGMFDGRR